MKIGSLYEIIAHHYLNRKKVTKVTDLSREKKLLILATGISASEYWSDPACQDIFSNHDILVMNRSIYKMEEQIFKIKPRYFAACDSIYWGVYQRANVSKELVLETYRRTKEVLEKIDWDCYLITTIHENFDFTNPKIHIIRLNATATDANSKLGYLLYQYNFCSPKLQNVAQLAIYFGITFGYKELSLVGIDFDFIKNMFCDENCRVGQTAEHQYDKKGEMIVTAYYDKERNGAINNSVLAKYLYETADTISCFGKLGIYAEKRGCKIINHSVNSLIDCYEKKRLRSKED